MNTKRIPERAGPVGTVTRCRWCGKPKPWEDKYRRTFCSDECVEQHLIRTQPAHAAKRVLERDHGVCRACGVDTVALLTELTSRLRDAIRVRIVQPVECVLPLSWGSRCGHHECIETAIDRAIRHGHRPYHDALRSPQFVAWCCERSDPIPPHLRTCKRRLWEMDHITPVVEGGADCGLDNLRTLCWACHLRETAKLAARRAEARREAKGQP